MNKNLPGLMNKRKLKTQIALCIRVFALVAIVAFYIISSALTDHQHNGKANEQGM